MRTSIIFFIVFFCITTIGISATLKVPSQYPTIQQGIDAAVNGDTVLVAPGTYVENIDFLGKAVTVMSSDGPGITIIDGNQMTSVVTFQSGEGPGSLLEGFTITNGSGTPIGGDVFGGGIFCLSTSPTLENNIISANSAKNFGGGIACSQSSPSILGNVISGNTSDIEDGNGGGIYCFDSSALISGNLISSNKAGLGGGILCWSSSPDIKNNLITSNEATGESAPGGGIYCYYNSNPLVTNCTIHWNMAYEGGGIYMEDSSPTVTNTIIRDNGIEISNYSGNSTIAYCDIMGGWPGAGNIDADPLFFDAANGDYHLQQAPCQPGVTNPCVDAGDPNSPMIEGSTRTDSVPDRGIVDMGYHYAGFLIVPDDYPTIQSAIDAAEDGDAVVVYPGTYTENIDLLGKAITVASRDGPGVTVIDGNQSGSVVTFASGEGPSSIIEGFTLTAGHASDGGGIYCYNSSPSIQNSIIRQNTASSSGGGVCCLDAFPILVNTIITENSAFLGGGIYSDAGAQPIVTNSIVYDNSASSEGGGFHCGAGSPIITNSILWQNSAPLGSQVQGTNPAITHSDVQGGWPGTGNIDTDPLFVDPGTGDFHITDKSPCFNKGDNNAPEIPERDFDGDPRIVYMIVDMGIYEVHGGGKVIRVPLQFSAIQEAIDAAYDGDTVLVGPGTYFENLDFKGKPIKAKSELTPDITIIDGNQSGSVVRFGSGETKETIIEGFTISNGAASIGGGILCDDSTPMIVNNIIATNTSTQSGGGISCVGKSSPTIVNNIISDNSSEIGGGLFCDQYALPIIMNTTITENNATHSGGGICLRFSSMTVTNTIVWNNNAQQGWPEIRNFFGTANISHCNVKGGWPGIGNIDSDPLFVDPANDDFHLTFPSPCKDTGGNSAVTELYDFEGDPRIAYGAVDMGADEFYTHLYWTGDATPGGNVALKFVGLPGTTPVQLWLGSGVLDPPWPTQYGDWYLQFPLLAYAWMGSIPTPNGVLILPFVLSPTTPTPLSLPFQAGVGMELTNPSVMEVTK